MDFTMILPILIGVGILFVVLKLLALPMKLIIKLVINGIAINLNWITALIVGILGVPGVVIVAILQFVM